MRDVLVACIGNVFHGDDGFGVEVARRLAERGALGPHARVVDFGIRGMDLALALSSGIDAAVLVDATARGGEPGTLYVLAPDEIAPAPAAPEAHGMHPVQALALAQRMGGVPRRVRVVGCEPEILGDDEEPIMGLSPRVDAAASRAVDLVASVVRDLEEGADA